MDNDCSDARNGRLLEPGGNTSVALRCEAVRRIDGLQRESLLIELSELEDRFYHFVEYLESFGEEDFAACICRVRDSVASGTLPDQELSRLARTVESIQYWPREIGAAMNNVYASLASRDASTPS